MFEIAAIRRQYAELIEGNYDCVDRVVINSYNPLLQHAGGFRHWWRQWKGSDAGLETAGLMRIAMANVCAHMISKIARQAVGEKLGTSHKYASLLADCQRWTYSSRSVKNINKPLLAGVVKSGPKPKR